MKKWTMVVLVAASFIAGCATHYGARPPLQELKHSMERSRVIEVMGEPKKSETRLSKEGMLYSWDDPLDGGIGASEEYFVVMQNGKLIQYGVLTKGAEGVFGLWRAIDEAPSKAFKDGRTD